MRHPLRIASSTMTEKAPVWMNRGFFKGVGRSVAVDLLQDLRARRIEHRKAGSRRAIDQHDRGIALVEVDPWRHAQQARITDLRTRTAGMHCVTRNPPAEPIPIESAEIGSAPCRERECS